MLVFTARTVPRRINQHIRSSTTRAHLPLYEVAPWLLSDHLPLIEFRMNVLSTQSFLLQDGKAIFNSMAPIEESITERLFSFIHLS